MKKKKSLTRLTEKELFYIAFAFFIFMMLFNLMHSSLWGDEWAEYYYSQADIRNGDLYRMIIRTFQPPLYNFIMHFWLKISKTILWFRLFNVLCGVLAGISLYKTVDHLIGSNWAAGALFALGATYRWVYCVQECSEYALMLLFCFLAFYFYLRENEENNLLFEFLFILSCVGAMYSQYGAFFVIAPLLLMHLIGRFFAKNKKMIIRTGCMYSFSFVFFAIPLYIFFAKIQMNNNAIHENSSILFSLESVKNLLFVFGKIVGYFLNINGNAILRNMMTVIGISIILSAIFILTKNLFHGLKKAS